jgi:hypothetical protein
VQKVDARLTAATASRAAVNTDEANWASEESEVKKKHHSVKRGRGEFAAVVSSDSLCPLIAIEPPLKD